MEDYRGQLQLEPGLMGALRGSAAPDTDPATEPVLTALPGELVPEPLLAQLSSLALSQARSEPP